MSEITSTYLKGKSKRKASATPAASTRNTRLRTASSTADNTTPSRNQSDDSDALQDGRQGGESLEVKREMMDQFEEHRRTPSQDQVDDRIQGTLDDDAELQVKEEGLSEEEWGRGHQFLSRKFGQFGNAINDRVDCISENVGGVMTGITEQTARLDAIEPADEPGRLREMVNSNTAGIGELRQTVDDHTTRMKGVESGVETMRTTMTDTERQLRADMESLRATLDAEKSARVALKKKDDEIVALRKALEQSKHELSGCKAALATMKSSHETAMAHSKKDEALLLDVADTDGTARKQSERRTRELATLRKSHEKTSGELHDCKARLLAEASSLRTAIIEMKTTNAKFQASRRKEELARVALEEKDAAIVALRLALEDKDHAVGLKAADSPGRVDQPGNGLRIIEATNPGANIKSSKKTLLAELQIEREKLAATRAELAAKHSALLVRSDERRRRQIAGKHSLLEIKTWEVALKGLRTDVSLWSRQRVLNRLVVGQYRPQGRKLELHEAIDSQIIGEVKTRLFLPPLEDGSVCEECGQPSHWSFALYQVHTLLEAFAKDRYCRDLYLESTDVETVMCHCTLADVPVPPYYSENPTERFTEQYEEPIKRLENPLQEWALFAVDRTRKWTGIIGLLGIALLLSIDAGIAARAIARLWLKFLPKDYSKGLSATLRGILENIDIVSSIVEPDL